MKQRVTKRLLKAAVAFAITGICFQPASAAQNQRMKTSGSTSQPIGHYDYCKQQEADCRLTTRNTSPVKLTRERWQEMVRINTHANQTIVPVTDQDYYGREELWVMPEKYGDCEDYALVKRKRLMELGWPASSLLVTVVRQLSGDGHAVLTVRTDRADYILDNLNDEILAWSDTEYTYLKRQSAANSGKWEGILDNRSVVGSIK